MALYEYDFLPLVECILTYHKWFGHDLILNQQSLSTYLGVHRRVISSFLEQAETDGLLISKGKVRKYDDKVSGWAMRKYELAPSKGEYFSRLQDYINQYMLWEPYIQDRMQLLKKYTDSVKANTEKTEKQVKKEAKNLEYRGTYAWATELLDKLNKARPVKFQSSYLNEGKNREVNVLCPTLNPDKPHDRDIPQDVLLYRNVLLSEYFDSAFEEYDTNGSIYRLSYSLHRGFTLSHNVDVYKEFWRIGCFGTLLDKTGRDCLKVLCMPIFMSNGAKNGWNALIMSKDDSTLSKSDLLKKSALTYLCKQTGLEPKVLLDRLTKAMKEFLGTEHFLEEEIFIHESNLHILIMTKCMERGIKTINVYDGFYFQKDVMSQDLFDELYDDATLELITRTAI